MKNKMLKLLGALLGVVAGAAGAGYLLTKEINLQKEKVSKYKNYYNLLNQWITIKQENKNLKEYFINNNIRTIAIYGMGELGTRLVEELKDTEVVVEYAIDKNAGGEHTGIQVYGLEDELREVDVIIITAIFAFDIIQEEIKSYTDIKVLSLEDVIYSF